MSSQRINLSFLNIICRVVTLGLIALNKIAFSKLAAVAADSVVKYFSPRANGDEIVILASRRNFFSFFLLILYISELPASSDEESESSE